MKNNLWVISQKNTPKSSSRKSNKSQINPEMLLIDNKNFYRISLNHEINTAGEHPLILYKKRQGKICLCLEFYKFNSN